MTLAGRVAGSALDPSPLVTAALIVGDGELPLEHRATFVLETDDGRRIDIEPAKNPVLRPVRKEAGPWRQIEQHPARPTGDFHPDGHVKLRGEWIVPGERVVVIGYVKEHDFVPDTGGHRHAPERQISRVRAIAIGCGDDPADAANDAMRAREKRIEEQLESAMQLEPKSSAGAYAVFAIVAAVTSVLLVVFDRARQTQTFGLAMTGAIFALLFLWRSSPVELVPGGAVDEEEVTDPNTMVWFHVVLMIPLTLVLFWLGGDEAEPGKRNGITNAGWILLGPIPIWKIGFAMLSKPRAEKGSQAQLPIQPWRRWLLLLGLLAIWIASIVMAVPYFEGDGAM